MQRTAAYLTRNTPRYTSYPTAPHFSDAVGADSYEAWLEGLDPAAPVSLYLHVPFCKQVCWYCGCNMKLAARYEPVSDYLTMLLQEIDLLAERLPTRMKVSCIHWGGGTPTTLKPDDLARAVDALRRRFDFCDDAEIAIESDPRTLGHEMIQRIGALGFNRASFGVQEFDPDVQQAINRIQPPDMVRRSVEGLREAGVQGINFDLIYGLPKQTEATLARTIDLAAAMAPDRVALFGYAHVPWMAKKQRMIDTADLPGAAERLAQSARAAAKLLEHGYRAIGLDHFARPDDALAHAAAEGTLRRNFQGYTTDQAETLLGLGATSIGRTPHGYVQNIAETGAWARAVSEKRLPVGRGVAFSGEDKLRGHVIEQLMCFGAVDLAEAGRLHSAGPDWARFERQALAEMAADDLLTVEGDRLALTEAGKPLVRVVAAVFDAYLAKSAARHSVAV